MAIAVTAPVSWTARLFPWGLAGVSGVLYFTSFLGYGQFYLTWICLVPVLWALRGVTPRRAMALGAFMGWVTHLGGYAWIIHLLREFAFLPVPLAVLGYALLCAAQGFSFGIWAWLSRRAADATGLPLGLCAAVALVGVEFAYPMIFPSYTANAQLPFTAIVQIADLGGVHAVNLLLGLVNGALFELLVCRLRDASATAGLLARRRSSWRLAIVAAGVFVLSLGYGLLRLPGLQARDAAAPKLRVGITQNDFGAGLAHQKPREGLARLQRQTRELAAQGAELVVWPESGFRGTMAETAQVLPPGLTGANVPVLLGALRRRFVPGGDPVSLNSAVLADAQGNIHGWYDKIFLLAFGEYIPLGETFPFVYRWSPYSAHFARGTSTEPLRLGPWSLATVICYEDILPRLYQEVMAARDGQRPHLLANITNDSWYGDGHEQIQHLGLAAFRSIEHRRWLVRSTNTGISAFVDSAGRIRQRTGVFEEATLLAEVPMLEGTTVYERVGDVLGWAALLALAAALGSARVRR